MTFPQIRLVGGKPLPSGRFGGGLVDANFRLTVRTTVPSESFTLPMAATVGDIIDWGDGSSTTVSSAALTNYPHTYSTPDDYEIAVSGQRVTRINFNNSSDAPKLRRLSNRGIYFPEGSQSGSFFGCSNLTVAPDFTFDITESTDLSSMIRSSGIESLVLSGSASSITSVANFADNTGSLISVTFPAGAPASAIDPSRAFRSTSSLEMVDFGGITLFSNLIQTFSNASSLSSLPGHENWDVSGILNFSFAFFNCGLRPDIGSWRMDSLVNGTSFLDRTGTDQYDDFWLTNDDTAWNQNVTLHMGDSTYDSNNAAVVASRQRFIDTTGNTLIDGGATP